MLAHPEHPSPPAAAAPPPRRRRRGAFTLIETTVALAVFVIGGLGVIEMLGLINNHATIDRALTAARLLVGAKIAKAQTDTWTPSNNVVPVGCQPPYSGSVGTTYVGTAAYTGLPNVTSVPKIDPADTFDTSGIVTAADGTKNNVVPLIVNSADTGPVITGTWTQTVTDFEAASQSKLITYTLTFVYRGKTYAVSQSTVRAPDQL